MVVNKGAVDQSAIVQFLMNRPEPSRQHNPASITVFVSLRSD